MAGNIKGLELFIRRIRACTNSQEENQNVEQELAKIRKYFADRGLSPYNKKKCVWKLVYIGVMGYDVDIGHAEALQLINCANFTEKICGYLAMSLLFNESNLDSSSYILNCIKDDLLSGNEISQSLALCSICNFTSKSFAEQLVPTIARIAFGETGNTFYVQKRAILCLTSFVRKFPTLFSETWSSNYYALMQSKSFGVLQATCSLLLACANQFGPGQLTRVGDMMVTILGRLVEDPMGFAYDYTYHGTYCPWLQVKLLQLLQLLPPPAKEATLATINALLCKIVGRIEVGQDINRNNAEHAVLFEAINLALYYKKFASSRLMQDVLAILTKYMGVNEPNIRYLALEALAKLEDTPENTKIVATHKSTILVSLRDRDLSIRRRALDVLFALCSKDSAPGIVNELLEYLKEKDMYLKEELVLKIAILAEKFGDSILWYIDVILKTLELAGNFVSDDVWFRISQVITGFGGAEGSPETQRYAAMKVFAALNTAHAHEPLVKLGAYLMGEYGELIVDSPAGLVNGPRGLMKQFEVLSRHYSSCPVVGRCMVLSAFAKLAAKSPEMKEPVVTFLESVQGHWDLDIQQRATEYLALINAPNFEEKKVEILDKMPVFPEAFLYNNVILKSLEALRAKERGKTPAIMPETKKSQPAGRPTRPQQSRPQVFKGRGPSKAEVVEALEKELKKPAPVPQKTDLVDTGEEPDLRQFQTMSIATPTNQHPFYAKYAYKFAPEPTVDPAQVAKLAVPTENSDCWKKLIAVPVKEGVIFDGESITVGMKAEYVRFTGRVILQFVAKKEKLEDIVVDLQSPPGLEAQCSKVKYPANPKENPMLMIQMMLAGPFEFPPMMSISFQCGHRQEQANFGLPVLMARFIEPVDLPQAKFTEIWTEITGKKPSFEKMDTILKNPAPPHLSHMDVLKRMAQLFHDYFGLHVVRPEDPANFTEISAAGQLVVKSKEQTRFPASPADMKPPVVVPVLAQAEFFPDLSMTEFRFSIRSSDVMPVSGALLSLFKFFVNPTS